MKNIMMVMVVVLSFVVFLIPSFAGMLKPLKPGEVRKTGQSIYQTRRTQAVVTNPTPVPKTEAKINEKKK